MITQLRKFPALLFTLVALVAVSCNTNDNPVDPGTKPGTPTALMAQSRSETSVGLKWDASAGGVTPTGYRVYFNIQGQVTKDSLSVLGASATEANVAGLLEGTVYDFSVAAVNGSVVGSATAALPWAPARRAGMVTPIKIYSFRSGNGSGLGVFDVGAPTALTVDQGAKWDLAFDDKVWGIHPDATISSPGQTDYVEVVGGATVFKSPNGNQEAKIVFLGRVSGSVNSLDDIWETEHLNDAALSTPGEKTLPLVSTPGDGFGFVFASQDPVSGKFNYGKALVLRTNGNFIQGNSPDQYIQLQVSYQTGDDVPYAVRAAVQAAALQSGQRLYTPAAR